MTVKQEISDEAILPIKMSGELVSSKLNPIRQFSRVDFYQFIHDQKAELWWNSAERNEKLSAALNALVIALIERNINEVVVRREQIRKYVIPWVLCGRNFLRLAFVEYAAFCRATGERMMEVSRISGALGFLLDKTDHKIIEGKLRRSKIVGRAFASFEDFRAKEIWYRELPVVHCAVCATMGAGKSTFINALLGRDVLPSRNEATTAKVTSVYDKDGSDDVVGFCQVKNGITDMHCGVSLKKLDMWNSDTSIKRIFLRGDFDGIGNKGMIVAIHDTPGTNNSSDSAHHKITLDFLSKNTIDLLVFVLNAEQLGITDEKRLLDEILPIVKKRGIPILFVLNKADSIDSEKEDLKQVIERQRTFLVKFGFQSPSILPVAAKASRLLKMALYGHGESMTEGETDYFPILVRRMAKRPIIDCRTDVDMKPASRSVDIAGVLYSETDLENSLKNSGLFLVERKIEEILLNRKEKKNG